LWLQNAWYMRNRSPAKMAASDPPAPGRISIRHGRWANGCTGTSEVIRDWEALASSVRVSPRSSAASARSSGSVVDSCISETSSVTDLAEISMCCSQALQKSHTSLALSHCCNAFTIGLYSPSFFATRVSKPLASFSVRLLCSTAMLRALVRSAGGIDSSDAACAMLADYACRIRECIPVVWRRSCCLINGLAKRERQLRQTHEVVSIVVAFGCAVI
jgi:hypothetical protein